MSILSKSDYDYINLAACIRGQANWLGIEHEGIPLEGVVVRIANATPPGSERADRERVVCDHGCTAVTGLCIVDHKPTTTSEQAGREPGEPVHVQIAARKSGKHSTLADMIVERANAKGVRVEFVTPDRETSEEEVEAAADAIVEAFFGQDFLEAPIDLARAALLAAQKVRNRG